MLVGSVQPGVPLWDHTELFCKCSDGATVLVRVHTHTPF